MNLLHGLKEVCLILTFAAASALAVNAFSSTGVPLVGAWDSSRENVMDNDGMEIDLPGAERLYLAKSSIFVDARPRGLYEEGHIKDAISFPVRRFDDLFDDFMNVYPTSMPIVAYCSGRSCEDSHRLAQDLSEMGYSNVKVFTDGFAAWKDGGKPIER